MKYGYYYETKIGKIAICEDGNGISDICFSNIASDEMILKETDIIKEAAKQIYEYLDGKREEFDLKLSLNGTEFQKLVWNELRNIKYGETNSYKDIAIKIGNEKACRAVGGANNKNPIVIVIPCHRIISANKSLGGYSEGIDIKKKLLQIEGITID